MKKIIIPIFALVLIGGFFVVREKYFSSDSETKLSVLSVGGKDTLEFKSGTTRITSISEKNIKTLLIANAGVEDYEIADFPPEIFPAYLKNNDGLILFVEVPLLSGTGGSRIKVMSTNLQGTSGRFIYDFFGSRATLIESIKVMQNKLAFIELNEAGACCFISQEVVIDTDSYFVLKPQFPDSLDAYIKRHNLQLDPHELSDSVANYDYISTDIITLERAPYTSIDDKLPKEIWQYNVETRQYKQIN